jgi:uroporphyrinogen decarboxylase
MDAKKLKKEFGNKLCFHGGIDIQYVLNQDSLELLENEVKTKIKMLAPEGGYILAATHNIQPDTSIKNIEMLFRFARQFGTYPISI